jgi:glutamate-ammonia-ligase adenylyltransferase
LAQLVKLCAASGWIGQASDPLSAAARRSAQSRHRCTRRWIAGGWCRNWTSNWRACRRATPKKLLNALRYFKQGSVLRVAAADVSGAMPLMIVSDHLTEIAEVLLRKVLELAWTDLLLRFGHPSAWWTERSGRRASPWSLTASWAASN